MAATCCPVCLSFSSDFWDSMSLLSRQSKIPWSCRHMTDMHFKAEPAFVVGKQSWQHIRHRGQSSSPISPNGSAVHTLALMYPSLAAAGDHLMLIIDVMQLAAVFASINDTSWRRSGIWPDPECDFGTYKLMPAWLWCILQIKAN